MACYNSTNSCSPGSRTLTCRSSFGSPSVRSSPLSTCPPATGRAWTRGHSPSRLLSSQPGRLAGSASRGKSKRALQGDCQLRSAQGDPRRAARPVLPQRKRHDGERVEVQQLCRPLGSAYVRGATSFWNIIHKTNCREICLEPGSGRICWP
ncbi:hypothetical protein L209DRAFT_332591 [Thermothelomyces heterothallicus CBS 203.75]